MTRRGTSLEFNGCYRLKSVTPEFAIKVPTLTSQNVKTLEIMFKRDNKIKKKSSGCVLTGVLQEEKIMTQNLPGNFLEAGRQPQTMP